MAKLFGGNERYEQTPTLPSVKRLLNFENLQPQSMQIPPTTFSVANSEKLYPSQSFVAKTFVPRILVQNPTKDCSAPTTGFCNGLASL